MSDLLLDTCALIWTALGEEMTAEAQTAIETAPLHISAISALEIGILVRRNRIVIGGPGAPWFDTLWKRLGAKLQVLSPALLFASTELAGNPPPDPFDRIMIATARANGLTLVTRDHAILGYCHSHGLATLKC